MADDLEMLEAMVDRHGLADLLHLLGDICGEKSAHIATNWQDTTLAKQWDANAELMLKTAGKVAI